MKNVRLFLLITAMATVVVLNTRASKPLADVVSKEFALTVDYSKTLEQMIVDGKYREVDEDITAKNFQFSPNMIGKKVEIFAKLFNFGCDTYDSKDVINIMQKAGYRQATLAELLALGSAHPDLNSQLLMGALGFAWYDFQVPIIALGSVFRDGDGGISVPCLSYCILSPGKDKRDISSYLFADRTWNNSHVFLGVRE